MRSYLDWLPAVLPIGLVVFLLTFEIPRDVTTRATLAGAAIGSAAIFIGNWINRSSSRRESDEDARERVCKLQTVLACMLEDVAEKLVDGGSYIKNCHDVRIGNRQSMDYSKLNHILLFNDVIFRFVFENVLHFDVKSITAMAKLKTKIAGIESCVLGYEQSYAVHGALETLLMQSLIAEAINLIVEIVLFTDPQRLVKNEFNEDMLMVEYLRGERVRICG